MEKKKIILKVRKEGRKESIYFFLFFIICRNTTRTRKTF